MLGGEDIGENGFPLFLLLDGGNNIGGVWKSDNRIIVVELSEVLSKLEQQPLQMENPFERS